MIRMMIHAMLGDAGDAAVVLMLNHQVELAAFLGVWVAVVLAAKLQLRRIEGRTAQFVAEESRRAIAGNPGLTSKQLYRMIYPRWAAQVAGWAWFVPHRWELWPVPSRLDNILQKFPFSAAWLEQSLGEQGLAPRASGDER